MNVLGTGSIWEICVPSAQFCCNLKSLCKIRSYIWLVWLSGLSASLLTKGLLVQFPVRVHAWVAVQVPKRGHSRGKHTLMFPCPSPTFPFSLKRK